MWSKDRLNFYYWMRIGIDASFLRKQGTGIGQVTINFLRKLMEFSTTNDHFSSNKEIEFILYLEEDIELKLPDNFQKKVFLPKWYKRDDLIRAFWWQKCSLPKTVKKDGCDVLLSMYQSVTVAPKKTKHIMIVHDIILELFPNYLNNWRKKLFWFFTKKAVRKVDKIIAVSKRTEKDIIHHLGIDPEKITVSYISADEIYEKYITEKENKRVMEKYGLEKGYIYTGGGTEARKNIEGTIRAYKIILDENRAMFSKIQKVPPLVISGKLMPQLAPLATDVQTLVASMGIEEKVKILDFVPQEDLPAIYKNALFFSYPSLYEGFGLPVLEAMTQGVPVLTSKKSSLPEVGADAVLYCNPKDINDIALVMKNLITREDLRKALSERALKRSKKFSWDGFANKVLNIIKDIQRDSVGR